jgi:raffinose/stachyose/melibiose transport system permease protein
MKGATVRARQRRIVQLARGRIKRGRGSRVPWSFLVPALLMYSLVVIYPNAAGAWYAFTDWDGLSADVSFVGLQNFRQLLNDGQAIASLKNTLLLALSLMILQNGVGLLLALALNSNLKSRNLLRTVFFAPAVLAPVVLAFLWKYIYAPSGPLNHVIGGLGLEQLQYNWLGNPSLALWSVVVVIVWQHAGLSMVIFLAGLQGVPEELYEAAALDGAGPLQRFWHVTRPMIAPATTIALILTVIGGLKLFDQIFAMTGGGPGYATETLSTIIYDRAFVLNDYSYATAIALVLSVIVAAIAFVQLKLLTRFEVEE